MIAGFLLVVLGVSLIGIAFANVREGRPFPIVTFEVLLSVSAAVIGLTLVSIRS